jgi:hypothetical protein
MRGEKRVAVPRNRRVIALLQLALMVCLTPSVLSHRDNFARVLILIPLLALHDYSYRGGRTRIGALAWLCCYGLLVAPGFL